MNLFAQPSLGALAADMESFAEADWPSEGSISDDGVAIIGQDGFAFLFGGGNNYYSAYQEAPDDQRLSDAWLTYIANIRHELEKDGTEFRFFLVPNKATVLPNLYPRSLKHQITCRGQMLLEGLQKQDKALFKAFQNFQTPRALFRRNDSHLTDLGNLLIGDLAMQAAQGHSDWSHYDLTSFKSVRHAGDLGGRFDPAAFETLVRAQHPTSKISFEEMPYKERKGKFVGLGYHTHNEAAPINKRVMLFGNSFIERVPSWGAAMVMAATFQDFRFIWYPAVDLDLVREWQPDLVIFQTCERFLSRAPGEM